jgi:hypothetical protein
VHSKGNINSGTLAQIQKLRHTLMKQLGFDMIQLLARVHAKQFIISWY